MVDNGTGRTKERKKKERKDWGKQNNRHKQKSSLDLNKLIYELIYLNAELLLVKEFYKLFD